MLSYRRVTWNTYRMHRLGMSENRGHSWNFSMCYVHVHWENEVLKQSILVDIYFQTKPREDARAPHTKLPSSTILEIWWDKLDIQNYS